MRERINVTRSSMPDYQEYCDEIKELWESHWLTNMGSKHRELQVQLEKYFNVPHVTLYTNGHLALENAIVAMDLPKGTEIITTPFTFASTVHAIVRSGFIPVFCDINEDDYTIDSSKIESYITNKTSAILPVHVYGNMCEVKKIKEIGQKYNLKVIYDAAHAFGVTYEGISAACFGDISMFSFHATKVFNTIEGGALCYYNDQLLQRLDDMKNFGIYSPEACRCAGGNAKMSEFQAAMGICNLRHVEKEIEKRKQIVEWYDQRLSGVQGIQLNKAQKNVRSNYAYYPVVFSGYKSTRDEVAEKLQNEDIIARKYFYPLTSDFECYQGMATAGGEKTPIARHIAESVLTLPLYADLSFEDVDRICDIVLG